MVTAHIAALPLPDRATAVLTITTSGGLCDEVWVWRRIVGETAITPIMPTAAGAGPNGGILLAGGSAIIADTEIPLDVDVEYLGSDTTTVPTVAASVAVEVESGGYWWLGCPEWPELNIAVANRRTAAASVCPTGHNVFTNGIGYREADARSTLTAYDGLALPVHGTRALGGPAGSLTLLSRTLEDLRAIEAILAPGMVLQLRAPGTSDYDVTSWYFSVRSVRYERVSTDLRKTWRSTTLTVTDVAPPYTASYGHPGSTFSDLCDVYSTWSAAEAVGVSLASYTYGTGAGGFPAAYRTCAEVLTDYPLCSNLTSSGLTCLELVTGEV